MHLQFLEKISLIFQFQEKCFPDFPISGKMLIKTFLFSFSDGFNEVLTLTWNPVRLTDVEISHLSCQVDDTEYKYSVHVVPSKREIFY